MFYPLCLIAIAVASQLLKKKYEPRNGDATEHCHLTRGG